MSWTTSSVYVYHVSELSLDEWLDAYRDLKKGRYGKAKSVWHMDNPRKEADETEWLADYIFSQHRRGVTLRDILNEAKMWRFDLSRIKREIRDMLRGERMIQIGEKIFPNRDEYGRQLRHVNYARTTNPRGIIKELDVKRPQTDGTMSNLMGRDVWEPPESNEHNVDDRDFGASVAFELVRVAKVILRED